MVMTVAGGHAPARRFAVRKFGASIQDLNHKKLAFGLRTNRIHPGGDANRASAGSPLTGTKREAQMAQQTFTASQTRSKSSEISEVQRCDLIEVQKASMTTF